MRKLLSVIIVYLVGWIPMFPCTSAVVSGRVTPDGRPLLWKHRDASDLNNRIVHFEAEGGKLEFVGLVNGVDTMANEVWAGYNTSGFAIMNTASYNLKNDTSSLSDREGVVMKQVLGECRTVEDFARLLDSLPRPIGVEANFGVVDALGGAAYFEVNSYEVFRYDVKDSPDGYLLRTNYSVSGRPNEGYGYIRYDNAARLFSRAASERSITPEWITGVCSRSFYHILLGRDFTTDAWVVDQDFIPRRSTSASVVIEGVKPEESPVFTTMWTILGYPPCSVVLPVWIGCEYGVPTLLQGAEDSVRSPLCEWSNRLKNKVFSLERGSGPHYLHMALLYNPEGNGYTQRLLLLEKEIYAESRIVLDEARRKGEWDNECVGGLLDIVQQKIVTLFGQILKGEVRMYFFRSRVMDWQNDILEKIKILFRGIGQVMFQNNAWSGVLMLVGIACDSLYMAGLALLGAVVSTSTARIVGYSRKDIRNGLYGFNGTLVGIAVGVFMNISVWAFMLLIIGAALSTWVMRMFQRQRFVSGYTAPFILVTWLLLLLERTVFPSLELSSDSVAVQEPVNIDFFQVFCLHIGQVMFQGGTVLSGLFFLVGIWINSRLNGLYAMWGAVLPLGAALFPDMGILGAEAGLLGYNGVLCAIALGTASLKGFGEATAAVLLSTVLQIAGMRIGITTLTAPFVLATWTVVLLRKVW